MSNWQPIETAPKDAEILVASNTGYGLCGPCTASFRRGKWKSSWDDCEVIEYMSDFGIEYKSLDFTPTHWMRLPEAPTP